MLYRTERELTHQLSCFPSHPWHPKIECKYLLTLVTCSSLLIACFSSILSLHFFTTLLMSSQFLTSYLFLYLLISYISHTTTTSPSLPSSFLSSSPSSSSPSDLEFALTLSIDWVALSFVQKPEDIIELRALAGPRVKVNCRFQTFLLFLSILSIFIMWSIFRFILFLFCSRLSCPICFMFHGRNDILTPIMKSTHSFILLYLFLLPSSPFFHYSIFFPSFRFFFFPLLKPSFLSLFSSSRSQLMAKLEKPSAIDYLDEVTTVTLYTVCVRVLILTWNLNIQIDQIFYFYFLLSHKNFVNGLYFKNLFLMFCSFLLCVSYVPSIICRSWTWLMESWWREEILVSEVKKVNKWVIELVIRHHFFIDLSSFHFQLFHYASHFSYCFIRLPS